MKQAKSVRIYTVVHEHKQGITLNSSRTMESAEEAQWFLKMEAAKEHGINVDECLDSGNEYELDEALGEFGDFIYIVENDLQ